MLSAEDAPPPAEHSDIAESELLERLQALIGARCGLSAMYQLLDDAKTMAEIRARYAHWQSAQNKSRGR